jgi:hypothetical protein
MEERAREIEGALDWLRSKTVGRAGSEPSPGFGKVPQMKMSMRSPEERTRDLTVSSALNWIRKGKGKSKKYDPSGEFAKLHKLLPKKRGQTEEERAREIG